MPRPRAKAIRRWGPLSAQTNEDGATGATPDGPVGTQVEGSVVPSAQVEGTIPASVQVPKEAGNLGADMEVDPETGLTAEEMQEAEDDPFADMNPDLMEDTHMQVDKPSAEENTNPPAPSRTTTPPPPTIPTPSAPLPPPTSQPATPSTVCPDNALPWFSDIFQYLYQPLLGSSYLRLMRAWTAVEEKHAFDKNKGATMNISGGPPRPAQLTAWINGGRRAKRPVAIRDIEAFQRDFWAWYISLQPKWRTVDRDGLPVLNERVGDDWGVLAVHGQNGLASILACVCWWGVALDNYPSPSWDRCVADVTWVAEELAKSSE